MKLPALYDPIAERVLVSCGHHQRRDLTKAIERVRHFCRDSQALYQVDRCVTRAVDEMITGLGTLERLIGPASGPQSLEVEEMRSAMNLVCLAAVHGADDEKSPASLSRALLLLSQAVPCPMRLLSLPPAVEVLALDAAPKVKATYETIRLWNQVGAPHVFLDRLYFLGCELRRQPLKSPELQLLSREVEIATALFRYAMQTLALADLGATGDQDGGGFL